MPVRALRPIQPSEVKFSISASQKTINAREGITTYCADGEAGVCLHPQKTINAREGITTVPVLALLDQGVEVLPRKQ